MSKSNGTNTVPREVERGAASIIISLQDGTITVTHGTDCATLLEIKDAKPGAWHRIWETLYNLKMESANDNA